MKNINSNLVYILSFIGITLLSFGITFGALSVLTKEDTAETSQTDSTSKDLSDKPANTEAADDLTPRLETLTLSENISIKVEIPQDWTVQPYQPDPASTDENDIPSIDIKSPEVINADGSGTGIHFCLTFANITSLTPSDRIRLDTPAEINSTELILGTPANIQTKTLPEAPSEPFMLVASGVEGQPSASYLTMPDATQVVISGQFKCRDNPEVQITSLTPTEFSTRPEVDIARKILVSASPSITPEEETAPAPETTTSVELNVATVPTAQP